MHILTESWNGQRTLVSGKIKTILNKNQAFYIPGSPAHPMPIASNPEQTTEIWQNILIQFKNIEIDKHILRIYTFPEITKYLLLLITDNIIVRKKVLLALQVRKNYFFKLI